MGTSRSAAQLAAKFNAAAADLSHSPREAAQSGAMAAKVVMVKGASAAGLRDGALVGRDRKRPARHGVGFNLTSGQTPTALIRYRVPRIVAIFNEGAVPHVISRKGDAFGPLKMGNRVVMGPVRHPGITGKKFWPATREAAIRAATSAARKPLLAPLKRWF